MTTLTDSGNDVSSWFYGFISLSFLLAMTPGCNKQDPLQDSIPAAESSQTDTDPAKRQSESVLLSEADKASRIISTTEPWPRVEVATRTFDFGRMPVGDSIGTHRFRIRNAGEADLELKAGEASCQCTSFQLESTRVPPGGETNVVIKWNTSTPNRHFRHGGPVFTNDPREKLIRFEVQGVIDDAIIVEPSLVWDAGTLLKDRETPLEVRVASPVFSSFQIESLTASSQFVRFHTRQMTSEELETQNWLSGHIVTAFFSEKLPIGSFHDRVTMKLNILGEPRDFEVRAIRTGPIRFLPVPGELFDPDKMLLRLGNFRATQGRQGKLMIIADHELLDEPLQISVEDKSPSFLKASLQPHGTRTGFAQQYLLTVEIPPGQEKHNASASPGLLKIRTNHPEMESFLLKLSFTSN